MDYLVDTNIFLHTITNNIYPVAVKCKEYRNQLNITNAILDELESGYYLTGSQKNIAQDVYNSVWNLANGFLGSELINVINIEENNEAKKEFRKIRDRYYMWMRDGTYLQSLINQGKITLNEIQKKSFRRKDWGECELIALASTNVENYVIITNDKGKVFLHQEQNVLLDYISEKKISVSNGKEWLRELDFSLGQT